MTKTVKVKVRRPKGRLKPDHSYMEQAKTFTLYVRASLSSVGCPATAINSYADTIERRLKREGFGFVKKLKSLFIQGVKTLGGDETSFEGWRLKDGYPRLYRWVFKELARLRDLGESKSEDDYQLIKNLLSLLFSPKRLKASSAKAADTALQEFVDRVTSDDIHLVSEEELNEHRMEMREMVAQTGVNDKFSMGTYMNLNHIGQKPSSLFKRRQHLVHEGLVRSLTFLDEEGQPINASQVPPSFQTGGPIGKACVLEEKGAKHRVIVSYNCYVHATNLYDKCRFVLDRISQDVSKDQRQGHLKASVYSSYKSLEGKFGMPVNDRFLKITKTKEIVKKRWFRPPLVKKVSEDVFTNDPKLVSCDLSSFTDLIRPAWILAALDTVNCVDLFDLLTEEEVQLPNGKLIRPVVPLMGFKGCFELASIIHNFIMKFYVGTTYALCGDDVVGIFDLNVYEKAVALVGLKLNRSKTVVSEDTCTFCGKVYHRGIDVSPVVPSFGIFGRDAKSLDSLQYNCSLIPGQKPAVKRFLRKLVKKTHGHYNGRFSYELPVKLGGFDLYRHSKSMTQLLASRSEHIIASNHVTIESKDREYTNRNPLPGVGTTSGKPRFPWLPTLLVSGGVKLPARRRTSRKARGRRLVGIDQIIDFYYTGRPVES